MRQSGRAAASPSVWRYLLPTFAITWTLWWWSGVLSGRGRFGGLFLLGVFAPGLVAVGFTAIELGAEGVARLLRRLVAWQVAPRWYMFAVGYIAVVKGAAALIYRVTVGAWPAFGREPWYVLLAATLVSTLVGGQAGEEVGWRGYVLPRLASRFGLGPASVLLGAVWALWHLPLFFAPGADTFRQSFPLYLLQVTALSVALAWLYARTDGSLLLVMLMHAAVNNIKDIVPSTELTPGGPWSMGHSVVGWLTVLVMWMGATYFLATMPPPLVDAPDRV